MSQPGEHWLAPEHEHWIGWQIMPVVVGEHSSSMLHVPGSGLQIPHPDGVPGGAHGPGVVVQSASARQQGGSRHSRSGHISGADGSRHPSKTGVQAHSMHSSDTQSARARH